MTTDLVIHTSTVTTVLGWLSQMWPIIVGMLGCLGGIIKYVAHKHGQCETHLAIAKDRICGLEGQVQVLIAIFGQHIAELKGGEIK